MDLTYDQQVILVESIETDPVLGELPHDGPASELIALRYNQEYTPTFWVYRTSVPKPEIVTMTSRDGTNFIWTGNGFIGRSQGELVAWQELFDGGYQGRGGVMNPSLANVRQALQDIFSGTGNAASNRAHLAVVCRRPATVVEHLYATGTGTTATPGNLGPEGPLLYTDVLNAWGATSA